jgi:hypothetical protein
MNDIMRRHYPARLIVNGRVISEIVIDPHYEVKHLGSINDEIILDLIRIHLDGGIFPVDEVGKDGHEYFTTEPLYHQGKPFRLVWLLPADGDQLGVVNCFRRSYGKGKVRLPE